MQAKQQILAGALATAIAAGTAALGGSALAVGTYDQPVELDLTFKLHIDDNIPEQDVFIEREKGSGLVFRPTKGERGLGKQLYAPLSPVKHAPFDAKAVGPYVRGKPLGITLGQWLAAEGTASYSCVDGHGRLEAQFTNLVPNGVYTLWHYFMAWPATDPFIDSYDIPVGARDGSESVFAAAADGSATLVRDFKPCLQLTGEQMASGIAIAWHSDRKTYGALPGQFSTKSHVHLYVDLPKRSGI